MFTPRRTDVIDLLGERDMLPALYFIFSRAACDDAVRACLDAGLRLTTPDERIRIREIVEERTGSLTDDDLDVLGYDRWSAALEAGLAAHHAGMVPPFKETVEACFAEGLVKAVFATETLALGVNMPARSVVIERLTKFDGEARAFLTPGEYTQLTGRAGRRGIDQLGYAIVLWSPFVAFDQVADLASSRTYGLRSAFRPTYNMAANLVARYEPAQARHLLNLSFAQFQADRAVVLVEARIERHEERIARLRREAALRPGRRRGVPAAPPGRGRGPGGGPARAQRGRVRRVAAHAGRRRRGQRAPAGRAVGGLPQGRGGQAPRHRGRRRRREPDARRGASTCRSGWPASSCPSPTRPTTATSSGRWPSCCCRARLGRRAARRERGADGTAGSDGSGAPRRDTTSVVVAHRALADHPVHSCPDRDRHARALAQLGRAQRELDGLRSARCGRGPSRWPAGSTRCCASSRAGATSTAGR